MPIATDEQMRTMLDRGRDIKWICAASGWTNRNVRVFAARVGVLFDEQGLPGKVVDDGDAAADLVRNTPPISAPVTARASGAGRLGDLLSAAEKSPRARTRALAEKVRASLTELRARVDAETKEAEAASARKREREEAAVRARAEKERAAARARAEKDAARAEVHQLEQQLRAARAKAGLALPNKEIRSWAVANGMACPARGKVPQALVAAYEAAHPLQATG